MAIRHEVVTPSGDEWSVVTLRSKERVWSPDLWWDPVGIVFGFFSLFLVPLGYLRSLVPSSNRYWRVLVFHMPLVDIGRTDEAIYQFARPSKALALEVSDESRWLIQQGNPDQLKSLFLEPED